MLIIPHVFPSRMDYMEFEGFLWQYGRAILDMCY
jgi:hypothetical protein